jgi:hypothetical protein
MLLVLALAACGKAEKTQEGLAVVTPDGFGLSAERMFQVRADWVLPLRSGGDGTNEVSLAFLTAGGAIPAAATVEEFHPRMPQMGNHGTDEATQAYQAAAEPATVRVTGIYFNMPGAAGEWVVTLHASVDGVSDEIKLAVPEVL